MTSPRPCIPRPWLAAVLISASACLSVPDLDAARAAVRLSTPSETAYTNGVLDVALEVTGDRPDRVELLLDDAVLATVEAPYTYPWDTGAVAEGTHRLVARAVIGGETFESEPREVVVDRTPPQVVSRTPEPGAQDVWVRSPIQAVFSEPVKAASLTDASVRLTLGSVDIARTVALSEDGKTVTVTPEATLPAPDTMLCTMTSAIVDLAGNPLTVAGASWSWAIPDFIPLQPLSSFNSAKTIYSISLALDHSDSPLVVTHEDDGSSENIYASRWTGSGWERLGTGLKTRPAPFRANRPIVGAAPDNTPFVSWHEHQDTGLDDYVPLGRWNGTQWDLLGGNQGAETSGAFANIPSLQFDDTGTPILAWSLSLDSGVGPVIQTSHWKNEGWMPFVAPLPADGTSQQLVKLLLGASNKPFVLWLDKTEALSILKAARWMDSDWVPLGERVAPGNTDWNSSDATLDDSGTPYVAWLCSSQGQERRVCVNAWMDEQWQSLGQQLITDNSKHALGPSISTDGLHRPVVAWAERGASGPASVHLRLWNGTSWAFAGGTLSPRSGNQLMDAPRLARGPSGMLAIAWVEANAKGQVVQVHLANH